MRKSRVFRNPSWADLSLMRRREYKPAFATRATSLLKYSRLQIFEPKSLDIKCFVIFLVFQFNSNKRITAVNQNSRLGTYKKTNLILKTTEQMIYKVLSLYYLHRFPPTAAVSLLG